jgi:hypothetical protein
VCSHSLKLDETTGAHQIADNNFKEKGESEESGKLPRLVSQVAENDRCGKNTKVWLWPDSSRVMINPSATIE